MKVEIGERTPLDDECPLRGRKREIRGRAGNPRSCEGACFGAGVGGFALRFSK